MLGRNYRVDQRSEIKGKKKTKERNCDTNGEDGKKV